MFQSLDEHSPMRYHVYYHLVQVAKQVDQVRAVFKDVDHLKQQFAGCPPSNEQMQKLLRLLHEVLLGCKQRFVFMYLVCYVLGKLTVWHLFLMLLNLKLLCTAQMTTLDKTLFISILPSISRTSITSRR